MTKRKIISLLTSLSLAASAFAALPVLAAEGDQTGESSEAPIQSQKLPRDNWSAQTGGCSPWQNVANMWDGDTESRWDTNGKQQGTEWIVLDLGAAYNVNKIELLSGDDYAREYKVSVSTDNSVFYELATGNGTEGTQTIEFNTVGAQYIKIEQTFNNSSGYAYWSIYELNVYGTASEANRVPAISTKVGNIVSSFAGSSDKVTVVESNDGVYNYYSMAYGTGAQGWMSMAADIEDSNRKPGATYSYSMMIYNPTEMLQTYSVKLAGSSKSYVDAVLVENVPAGEWKSCKGELVLPADDADVTGSSLQFQIFSGSMASFYVSDIYLEVHETPTINPYTQVEAETFSKKSDGEIKIDGTDKVGYIKDGSWIKFGNVNFGEKGASKFNVRLVSDGSVNANIELYLDNMDGAPVNTLNFEGSSQSGWVEWVDKSYDVNIPAGTYDLYMKFTGTGNGSGYLFNMDSWKFTEKENTLTATVEKEGEFTGIGDYTNEKATGYWTEISGTGSFNKVVWYANGSNEIWKPNNKEVQVKLDTVCTLTGGSVWIAMVVDGEHNESLTADVSSVPVE